MSFRFGRLTFSSSRFSACLAPHPTPPLPSLLLIQIHAHALFLFPLIFSCPPSVFFSTLRFSPFPLRVCPFDFPAEKLVTTVMHWKFAAVVRVFRCIYLNFRIVNLFLFVKSLFLLVLK